MNIIVTIAFGIGMLAVDQVYPAMEATNREDPRAAFEFPSSRATADDPVMIAAKDRKLLEEDREYRTDLQRYWLSVNVGNSLKFASREQVLCKPQWAAADGRCDRYEYTDSSGATYEFYFYLNNWP